MTDASTLRPLDVFQCDLAGINLIEASAGTGKTWNICGLYLRLLLERDLRVGQILVVTFTTAATAELRDRIRQRLVETRGHLLGQGTQGADPFVPDLLTSIRERHGQTLTDANCLERIELALASFDEAAIFTIHGFCQRALSEAAFAARMPLHTEIIQSDDDLRREVVNDFWRLRVMTQDMSSALPAYIAARRDTPARYDALLKRHLSRPRATRLWPDDALGSARPDIATLRSAWQDARASWHESRAEIIEIMTQALGSLNGNRYKALSITQASQDWDALLAHDDPTNTLVLPAAKAQLLGQEAIARSVNKNKVAPEHPFFQLAQACLNQRDALSVSLERARLKLLENMLTECGEALRAIKRKRHVVAYDDMLLNLHERLHSADTPWLAQTLLERFPAAFIDEFQDTDPLQYGIFDRIYGTATGPLFLVGDPKQSIYGFRNADLQTYLKARGAAHADYTLEQNQRSSAAMLRALNVLFGQNPALFMQDGLEYRPVTPGSKPRHSYSDPSGPTTALQVWTLPGTRGECAPLSVGHARRAAAVATAAEIVRLLDPSSPNRPLLDSRALRAGDIAILVRTHREASLLRQALSERRVGSVMRARQSIFATPEAEDLVHVLEAVLEPTRDRLIRAALATESMGMSAGQIASLNGDEAASAGHVQMFSDYRQHWLNRGVGYMLRQWMSQHAVAERQLGRPDGERRLTNLLHLFECIHQASLEHPAPEASLQWLKAQRNENRQDDETQLRLESDENLVQIVTVHASKGLEYPVIFCPFFWSGQPGIDASQSDSREYHDDRGSLIIDYRPKEFPGVDDDDIKSRQYLASAAEFIRLVYVAFTRAVHRCVVVAGCYSLQSNSVSKGARNLLNWMVAGNGMTPQAWFKASPSASSIQDAWMTLVTLAPADISVAPLQEQAVHQTLETPGAIAAPCALVPPRSLPVAKRIGSYSSLAYGAQSERAAVDHDLRLSPARSQSASSAQDCAPDDILRFPRGAAAGTCLHAVLEQIDFTHPASWPTAIEAALRLLPGEVQQAAARPMIERMLVDLTHTDLPVGTPRPLRLQALSLARRLTELEFHLPADRLIASQLNGLLARHGYEGNHLMFSSLSGYLKGFIDLVFEHDGRFFILDWKSNFLGHEANDYRHDALSEEMTRQGYHLQYLLYCVALQRYLQRRLPDYDPALHFGGVVYLFLRGIRPHWQQPDGTPTGLFFHRPDPALIGELSSLFPSPQARHA